MKPIVIKEDKDGNVKISAEEIQKMIDDAYEAGYTDGQMSYPIFNRTEHPLTFTHPGWDNPQYRIYCE